MAAGGSAEAAAAVTRALQSEELGVPIRYRFYRNAAPSSGSAGTPQELAARQGYSEAAYWEKRFQDTEGVFDWYATWQELSPIFREFCPASPELRVLNVGCGNSTLSADMYRAGYERSVNIDIAPSAVDKMAQEYKDLHHMEWRAMDATAMDFEDQRFDLCVDKGTVDAMMHGPSGAGSEIVEAMAAEVWRTLRPGGHFVLVSHNDRRQAILDRGASQRGAGAWELVELRRVRLSPQAMLINILRSKLQGRPLSAAFKDVNLLKEAAAEAKEAMKQMQLIDVFRMLKAKKERQAALAAERAGGEAKPTSAPSVAAEASKSKVEDEEDGETSKPHDPRRQPFCWVYILRRPAEA